MAKSRDMPEIKDAWELAKSNAYKNSEMPGLDLAFVYRLDVHAIDLCEQGIEEDMHHVALVNRDPLLPVKIPNRFSVLCSDDEEYNYPDYPFDFQKRDPREIIPLLRASFKRVLGETVYLSDLVTMDRDPAQSPIYRIQYGVSDGHIATVTSLIEPIQDLERTRAALRCLDATGDLENGTHITWNLVSTPKEGARLIVRPEFINSAMIHRVHVVTGLVPALADPKDPAISVYPLELIAGEIFKKLSEVTAGPQATLP